MFIDPYINFNILVFLTLTIYDIFSVENTKKNVSIRAPITFWVTIFIHKETVLATETKLLRFLQDPSDDWNQISSRLSSRPFRRPTCDVDMATGRLTRGSSVLKHAFESLEPNVLRWTPLSLARSIKAPAERLTPGYQPQSRVASASVSLVLLTQLTRRWSLPGSLCLT